MSRPFDPLALEQPLAPLDSLPRELWLPGIANSHGVLPARLAALEALHLALLDGAAPPGDWPRAPVLGPFAAVIDELRLARYCAAQPDVTLQVLRSLLWHVDRIPDLCDRECAPPAAAAERAARAFRADWAQRCGDMDGLIYVFGALGDVARSGRWDMLRGLLCSAGWQAMLRIRRQLERMPALARLLARLGRARETDEIDFARRAPLPVFERVTEHEIEERRERVPDMPGETVGVQRSGRIARMLAAESALLRHPRLRLTWFARHAERALLTYEEQDELRQSVRMPRPAWRPAPQPRPRQRLERGPLLLCVDTSGSMEGAAEQVAKALVLEGMRSAHAQGRACYLYAFGGPGEVLERPLPLDADGMSAAVEFLGQSFHGGTDVGDVLERALGRLDDEAWRLADLLIASDGEFGATPAVAARVRAARDALGLRVQGVLIGDRETLGLRELCDDVFWVRDWRAVGAGGASPVHDKSLTALYFPNALR